MKKYLISASIYLSLGLCGGVYFREFTKLFNFNGTTSLSFVHFHFLVLGFLFSLIVFLLSRMIDFKNSKLEKPFFILFNIGLPIMTSCMLIKGTLQVLNSYSTPYISIIAGIAGIGHMITAISLILFIIMLFKSIKKEQE